MKFFKRTDVFILLAIVAAAILLWVGYRYAVAGQTARAEIYDGSVLVKTIDLDTRTDEIFSIPNKEQVVFHLYEDGSIAFEQSDCPDKVCIRAGRLHTVGQSAACLPNELILKIVRVGGHDNEDIDMIIGK